MARHALIVFITALIFVIAGALFWQWHSYADGQKPESSLQITANQQIQLNVKRDSIQVEQIFRDLPNDSFYQIVPPAGNIKWLCIDQSGKPCLTDKNDVQLLKPQKGELRIQYTLPTEKQQDSLWLSDWTASLKGVTIQSTKIEVTDFAYRSGTWVTPYPLKGHKEQMYIDYSVFEGKGDASTIYWQRVPLYLNRTIQNLFVYSENPNEKFSALPNQLKLKNNQNFAVIQSTRIQSRESNGIFVIGSELNSDAIQKFAFTNDLKQRLKRGGQAEAWLTDTFLSLYFHQPPVTKKSQFIINELQKQLDQRQMDKFVAEVTSLNVIGTKEIDNSLGDLKGLKTRFFSSNAAQKEDLISLDFYETRTVYANGKKVADMDVLLVDQKQYYPFSALMKMLRYQVQNNSVDNSISLQKNRKSYRFYLNEHGFEFNGEKYGILSDPFSMKQGTLYISQEGFQNIFKINVKKSENAIFLTE